MQYIDETLWRSALRRPDWYLTLMPELKRFEQLREQGLDDESVAKIKDAAYGLAETALANHTLPLASDGEDFDEERRPIDTIIIHHSKNPPGLTPERLNAMHLLRLYGNYYATPPEEAAHLKGQPVWSNHFYEDSQVFWAYHWLIREDGQSQQLLKNDYIGWHAGDWDVNTRSVAICIDNDLTESQPSEAAVAAIAAVIREHYPSVDPGNVKGHFEVNESTECPGQMFSEVWKPRLMQLLT